LAVVDVHHPERAALHVFARQVPLALERSEVVVDPIGGTDAHVLADLEGSG
jgi:hypothetical protein